MFDVRVNVLERYRIFKGFSFELFFVNLFQVEPKNVLHSLWVILDSSLLFSLNVKINGSKSTLEWFLSHFFAFHFRSDDHQIYIYLKF